LLGGLANNASTESGLSSLSAALDRDHDGSMLDDLAGLVGGMFGGAQQDARSTNGLGILGHILGDRQEVAANQIGERTGLSMGQIMKLMPILAPIVMQVLGKAKSSANMDNDMLAGVLSGSAQQAESGGFGGILGNVLGSVLSGGRQQQQGGGLLGSVLEGIFKR
ncbi:MAG TPA: DUF937 domain-containing protein, partial [Saprospiraceae bacterium]|nr:DUF937 domain-containing protein [Saprospiraceae bacterium]